MRSIIFTLFIFLANTALASEWSCKALTGFKRLIPTGPPVTLEPAKLWDLNILIHGKNLVYVPINESPKAQIADWQDSTEKVLIYRILGGGGTSMETLLFNAKRCMQIGCAAYLSQTEVEPNGGLRHVMYECVRTE